MTLGFAASAGATPVTYNFSGGSAQVTASFLGFSIGSASVPLTGTQVTFDTAPNGLTSFQFTAGPTAAFGLSGILSGVSITLNSLNIVPGGGYTNYSVTGPFAPPSTYNYTVGPVAVSGSASLSGLIVGGPSPFSFTNPTLSGQIQLNGGGGLSLNGITLGQLVLPPAGIFPGGAVTLKADILFNGIVPEPGTALLLGSGLAGLAAVSRRRDRE